MSIFEASSRLIAQEELRYFTFRGWYYLPVKNGLLGNIRNFFSIGGARALQWGGAFGESV
jgi:hypothetical protein